MGKKIIVLNGSPRTNGNTSVLIDSFVSGAEESENTVKRFNLQQMNIHPCLVEVLAGGVMQIGDIHEKPILEKAKTLGMSIK
ncbi:NAD(P)H-dependent oxidoreductase [Clostridioides sp. ZZV15-6388]|uniref:flavodoxin family protein n=1 Tax=unclassified Clostridioides TaxID=2635829 RepID=UPI001D124E6E|nr:flavodoxin family protein [Clostridioides sp. ZZV15-6388]MCC0665753.1 flavodoxin family protein [Clostridioides sp. ZZV15-6597]